MPDVTLGARAAVGLAEVAGDAPAAALLVDLMSQQVVYANPVAVQLAPGIVLPASVDAWSDAAQLRDLDGQELSETSHPLSLVAKAEPVPGQAVSAGRASEIGRTREPMWVVGLPMAGAPSLDRHALVVFLPIRESGAPTASAAEEQAELRHQAILATGMSFTVADARAEDMPLVWVNPAFSATTGYSLEEVVGRNCRFLQGEATSPVHVAQLRQAIEARESCSVTLLNYRKDGSAFWNQLALSPISDPDGEITAYVGIQTDVTARVRADHQREKALEAERAAREAAEEARSRLQLLAEATTTLLATLDEREALTDLSRLTVPDLADCTAVVRPDREAGTEEVFTANRAGYDGMVDDLVASLRTTPTLAAALQQVLHGDSVRHLQVAQAEGVAGSVLIVPLVGREEVLAAMALVRCPESGVHSDFDLAAAEDLGRRAGLILDNARLYQAERSISMTLQHSLLPQLPHPDGLEVAARYYAGSTAADVGGDFYDVLQLPDGSTGVVIGDVSGHDADAAAEMGHLRGLLRASAWDTHAAPGSDIAHPPGDVLERVDRLMQGLRLTTLATAAYCRFVPAADGWRLEHSDAGHPPFLLRTPDGSVHLLESDGLMLGVNLQPRTTMHRAVEPGSVLLGYTDGLIERREDSLDRGIERLVAAFAAAPDDLEALCDHVTRALGSSEDDVALLAVRVGAPTPTTTWGARQSTQ